MNKEELKESLKRYKGILNNEMNDYLNSLIELDFSVIKDYVSDDDKQLLSELEIYNKIANYNIANRALNLIEAINDIGMIIKYDDDELRIFADLDTSSIMLFSYSYIGSDKYSDIKNGRISLYQTINSIEQKEKEINRLTNILDNLYNEKNPYPHISNVEGGQSSMWTITHMNQIQQYEIIYNKLQNKINLTDKDKKEIEITKIIHELFFEDYGLTNADFIIDKSINSSLLNEKTEMYKTYIKQVPKINIKNNIKYI